MKSSGKFIREFDWGLYPQTENFLIQHLDIFLKNNRFAQELSARIEHETSARFYDWIDHMVLPENAVSKTIIEEAGFQKTENIEAPPDALVFLHPEAVFFPVLLRKNKFTEVALKPERIDHFIQITGKSIAIEGDIYAPYRKAVISVQGDYILSAVERRGYHGFLVPEKVNDTMEYRKFLETSFCRQRYYENSEEGLNNTLILVKNICKTLSPARATDAFFRAERAYWERRNWIGQIQKARHDKLGLGWGNHDHHTYRSSRKNFSRLIKIFETLGFDCREQFFTGEEAGWGAQVMEHPHCNIVLFADTDITKDEKEKDFSHYKVKETHPLGTVGLWVALHGESILQAGLHHLAARFNFEKLRTDLEHLNIITMPPFSYFDFLKQAFTEGKTWNVDGKRLDYLLDKGFITNTQYALFLKNGAVGSHMENIQRSQGFKGFNQHSVSVIIKATDPRQYIN